MYSFSMLYLHICVYYFTLHLLYWCTCWKQSFWSVRSTAHCSKKYSHVTSSIMTRIIVSVGKCKIHMILASHNLGVCSQRWWVCRLLLVSLAARSRPAARTLCTEYGPVFCSIVPRLRAYTDPQDRCISVSLELFRIRSFCKGNSCLFIYLLNHAQK